MAQWLMIEEFHVSVWVPRGQPAAIDAAIRTTLDSRRFQTDLRGAIHEVVRQFRTLHAVRVRLTR